MYSDFLIDPKDMTDKELELEWEAVNSEKFNDALISVELPNRIREDFLDHKFEVEKELRFRKNEEWIYPITNMGFFNF